MSPHTPSLVQKARLGNLGWLRCVCAARRPCSGACVKAFSVFCLQAAPCPGCTGCAVCEKDLRPVEGSGGDAVAGRIRQRGAASSRRRRPSGGGLPKQVGCRRSSLVQRRGLRKQRALSLLCSRRKQRYQSAPRNIHRHVLLSEIKEAVSSLPLVRTTHKHHVFWILNPPEGLSFVTLRHEMSYHTFQ